MKILSIYRGMGRQRGVAAVELAIILALNFFMLPVAFLFGRVLYDYNVIKQATEDAALYIAALPPQDIQSGPGMAAARERAQQMVVDAIAAAGIRPPESLEVVVECDGYGCVPTVPPAEYTVWASYTIFDGFVYVTYPFLPDASGNGSWSFSARSTARNLN